MSTAKQAADLDKETVGGTWGTATSVLAKGRLQASSKAVSDVVGDTVRAIRERDNLMANYTMKYFNKLSDQLEAMRPYLSPNARLAYVVGCSEIKGVYVETDVRLATLLERSGFKACREERIRSRHSGRDLHESMDAFLKANLPDETDVLVGPT